MSLWVVWIAHMRRGSNPSRPRAAKARKLGVHSTRVKSRTISSRAASSQGPGLLAAALYRRRDVHGFPVFGHRSPGDVNTVALEQVDDHVV